MRLAVKVILVALGIAFLIAGFPSPRTGATTGGGSFSRLASAISQQPTTGDQSPADDETGSEQDSRDDFKDRYDFFDAFRRPFLPVKSPPVERLSEAPSRA